MRSFRLLVIMLTIALFYGATPMIGRFATTANASSAPTTGRTEADQAVANQNDNEYEDCGTGNPRKDKKCNYNTPNNAVDNDNSINDGNGDGSQPPVGGISVSNNDPHEGDTISFTVNASGYQLEEIRWWVTDFPNASDNDNEDGEWMNSDNHYAGCGGNNTCSVSSTLRPGDPGTFYIRAVTRDRQGRESGEMATEVRVHD